MTDIQTKLCHPAALAASATTQANDELDRLQARCAALEEALRESRRIVADSLAAFGPCDHGVGICNCDMKHSIAASDLLLGQAPAEGAKE